jgi:hypothetical protein
MNELVTAGYQFRELVKGRVRSYNFYGWASDFSQPNIEGALVRQLPQAISTVMVNAFQTNTH